jgi:D-tyrosyl-tRNA(Tyr) deacylase
MRACVQRVSSARVVVSGETVGEIGRGLLVLLGVAASDGDEDLRWLVDKVVGLRIFDASDGKMNLGLAEVGGELLVVSQFTLLGDCRKGRRPSFINAAPPEVAERVYEQFVAAARDRGARVATGRFRTHMEVALTNDGPVTIWIDSADR